MIIMSTNGNVFGGIPLRHGINLAHIFMTLLPLPSLVNAQKKAQKFDQNTIYGQYTQLGNSSYGIQDLQLTD